ncbi:MAG TPA: hypothetical protein VNZ86_00050, partial [Bacteroidia bacterium]|nr:hypothetical protein [Bacteroidia bacterium]
EHTVSVNGKNYTMCLFKLILKEEDKEVSYAGFTGPYDNTSDVFVRGKLTGSTFQLYDSGTAEELIKKYILLSGN